MEPRRLYRIEIRSAGAVLRFGVKILPNGAEMFGLYVADCVRTLLMSTLIQDSAEARWAPFRDWKAELAAQASGDQRFEQWVFLNASTVLLSEKTGELLALNLVELEMTVDRVEAALARLARQWGFEYRVLFESNELLKLIIFQEDRLQEALDSAPYCVMARSWTISIRCRRTRLSTS